MHRMVHKSLTIRADLASAPHHNASAQAQLESPAEAHSPLSPKILQLDANNQYAAERLNLVLALLLSLFILGFAPRSAHWICSADFKRGWSVSRKSFFEVQQGSSRRRNAIPSSALASK